VARLQADAARILSKVGPLAGHLKELKGRAHFINAPKDAKKNEDGALKDLEKMMASAEERVRGSSTEAFAVTLDEAAATAQGGTATLKHCFNTMKQAKPNKQRRRGDNTQKRQRADRRAERSLRRVQQDLGGRFE